MFIGKSCKFDSCVHDAGAARVGTVKALAKPSGISSLQ